MSSIFSPRATEQEENHWLSISDLMAGLMIVFLFIAIALMRDAMISAAKMREVAIAYQQSQVDIYNALVNEFDDDLERWDAEIDPDSLTFTFQSPDVLFETGQITLSQRYQELLADFFPRYLEVLGTYKDAINEVRIEGHTSSRWNSSTTDAEAYFLNMALSQGRTRSVLDYVYSLESVAPNRNWIKSHIAAVGLSSSRPATKDSNDDLRNQRVSFRVISNADVLIKKIIEVDG